MVVDYRYRGLATSPDEKEQVYCNTQQMQHSLHFD